MQINIKIITFISIKCVYHHRRTFYQTVQTKYHTAITHTVFERYEISYSYSQRQGSGCALITARKGQSPFLSHGEEDAIAEYLYEMDKRRMDIFSKAISLQIEIYRQVLNATHLI